VRGSSFRVCFCQGDDGDPETVSQFTILNADAELVVIRQVVSCATRDIYSVAMRRRVTRV